MCGHSQAHTVYNQGPRCRLWCYISCLVASVVSYTVDCQWNYHFEALLQEVLRGYNSLFWYQNSLWWDQAALTTGTISEHSLTRSKIYQERQAWCWTAWDRNVPHSRHASLASLWPAASWWYAPHPTWESLALSVRSLGLYSQCIPELWKVSYQFWLFSTVSHSNRYAACCWSWSHWMPSASLFRSADWNRWSCRHKSFSEGPQMAWQRPCFLQLRAHALDRSHAKLWLQFLVSPSRWSRRGRWCSHRACVFWVCALLHKGSKQLPTSTQVSFSWGEHWSWCPDYDKNSVLWPSNLFYFILGSG